MSSLVTDLLNTVHAACVGDRTGTVLDPVPELGMIDPEAFGICVATADGHCYEVGDSRAPFPIQSISKTFTFGLALEDRGVAAVAEKIDVEPSGDAFNEISLDPTTGRPRNPMINAGAITAASLVAGATPEEQFDRVQRAFSRFAHRDLALSEEVFAAEVEVGHRNRAIGHMLREFGILEQDPTGALDVYLRQCSLLVDCRDLARMAATLANGGVEPHSGERLLAIEHVDRVLSVMTTCGMYDGAGAWVADVGLPAKSGVGGGIIAVLPGQIGIAVFSPRLDVHGNSVRGVAACRQLSRDLGLHFLHVTRATRSAVHSSYNVATRPSLRERSPAAARVLHEHGHRARVYELQGDLLFAGAESVVRRAEAAGPHLDLLVLDVRRVDEVSGVAWRMLVDLRQRLREGGCEVVVVDPDHRIVAPANADAKAPVLGHLEAAIAWCEEQLLLRYGPGEHRIEPADHPLLAAFDSAPLLPLLETRLAVDGEQLVTAGDPPQGLFLVLDGRVVIAAPGDPSMTLGMAPGTSFGQTPLVTGRDHRFDVRAVGDTELLVLTPDVFARLRTTAPELREALVEALLRAAYEATDRSLATLAGRSSGRD